MYFPFFNWIPIEIKVIRECNTGPRNVKRNIGFEKKETIPSVKVSM